jgi:4-hydroxy-L-threonine phosphate dehydrogenase PdxA
VLIEAVLFDWNGTLVQFTWDDDLLLAGNRAALGRDDPDFTARYRAQMLGDAPQRPYAEVLRELGVDDPHIALAALNPHAGEGGMMGDEEIRALRPAVERARADGVDVSGPVPADAVFHQGHEGRFDGVIALYHDQGHIASKTLDFFGTVSATLGLPVIRTSVDHGTAYDLAGTWQADARGQVNARRVGAELAP